MNRKLIGTVVLSGLLLFLLISSLNVARAAPIPQETEEADTVGTVGEIDATLPVTATMNNEPLAQPLQITIRQRMPISIDLGQLGLTSEGVTITGALPLALELTIDFRVTDTLTSTVPSTVTLIQIEDLLTRLPVTMTLSNVTSTLVVIVPEVQEAEMLTTTDTLTETVAITSTPDITATVPVTPESEATPTATVTPEVTATETVTPDVTPELTPSVEAPEIAATSSVTANLRSGPATTFDLVGTASPGQELEIVAISNDAGWYLLASGQWIFAELVNDPPSSLPIATQELIDEVNAQAAIEAEAEASATPETTPLPEASPTPEATPEPTEEPIDEVEAEAPQPSANVDANLRAGPGTQFDVIGGTITGQEVDIVGQNSTGEWYLLSNGGWIAATLVDNPPSAVPVVADDASPLLNGDQPGPILVPTPAPNGSGLVATPAAEEEAGAQPALLGLAENLYLDEVRTLIARYDLAGDAVLQLVAAVQADGALLQDEAWQDEMNTAIATIRRTGQQIRSLEPPPLFGAAQIDLRSATGAFDLAATLLEEGLSENALDKLEQSLAEADTGRALLQNAQEKISAVTQ